MKASASWSLAAKGTRAASLALVLAAVCGCAAAMHPASVDAELARHNAPIVKGGQSITGYFDGHGLYRRAEGTIRRAKDGMLELSQSDGFMRTKTTRLPVDSVRTVITRRERTSPLVPMALAVLTVILVNQ